MSENSKIEWCDHTFNPWIGCTKVSPGCVHCYAEARDQRFAGGVHWGKGAPRQLTSDANWRLPVKWNKTKICTNCGTLAPVAALICPADDCAHFEFRRPRVFCASLADWLDDEVPIEWLARLLDLIAETPNLDWLLLTKRPQNWYPRIEAVFQWLNIDAPAAKTFKGATELVGRWFGEPPYQRPPANVWIGTTVEDQNRADERIPALLDIPAKVRFLSCEPLLGPLDIFDALPWKGHQYVIEGIDWVICGGESGSQARPMHPDWARNLRRQCAVTGVPFLFKQWGEWVPTYAQYPQTEAEHEEAESVSNFGDIALEPDGTIPEGYQPISPRTWLMSRVGKHAAGRLLDGIEHNGYPA